MDPPSQEDLAAIEEIPFDESALKAGWGVEHFDRNLTGEEALRELLLEPTANIAGMQSGYAGPGAKTIVPAEASVKMDLRLVAGQNPGEVLDLLRLHLQNHDFPDVEVVDLHGVEAAKTPLDSPIVQTAAESWRALGHDEVVVYPTIGGSGPTSLIATEMGIPTVITGAVTNAGSRIHAPNESARLEDYYESIAYFAELFRRFAA
jgi:acetylornithine deacetylase/succinyl-diaminopimelate desuccinylase-like protein